MLLRFQHVVLFLFVVSAGACGTTLKQRELEAVAKDWSMVVRASQVIPVYPLTEDLQPGDVFLVETPIQQQAKQYREKGFLPLDQHLTRLKGLDYGRFYNGSFGIGGRPDTPHHWRFPDPPPDANDPKTKWVEAPRAAFPSYAFKVKSGAGLQLALPVQGVPVGLHLMQTDAATGSITIADAHSFGLSFDELRKQVSQWASARENRELLAGIREQSGHIVYLRVINRVYVTGQVTVSLSNDQAFGAEGSVGDAKEIKLLEAADQNAVKNFQDTLAEINKTLDTTLPGGTVKVVQASSRTVTMAETFDRPLVIGYVAFDFPVFENGDIGVPLATRTVVENLQRPNPVRLGVLSPPQEDYRILKLAVDSLDGAKQATIYDGTATSVGGDFKIKYDSEKTGGATPSQAFAKARTSYILTTAEESRRRQAQVYDALRASWREAQ